MIATLTLTIETFISHALFIERLIASFLFKKYEQKKHAYFGIISAFLIVGFILNLFKIRKTIF